MVEKICIECGEFKEHYGKGLCPKCYGRMNMRKFRKLNPEKDHERKRNWYLKNKEKVCFFRKRSRYLKMYNLSLGQLEDMKKEQNNKCLICNGEYELKVDHDHKTGKTRGLLCDLCNRGLGYFKDNYMLLKNASKYLKERQVD
jgi:hypothetical protein